MEAPPSPLSSRSKWRDLRFSQPAADSDGSVSLPFVIPTAPRISYYAAPSTTTYAAFIEESRMKFTHPTKLDRKSGGSGGICSFLNRHLIRMEAPLCPLSPDLALRLPGCRPGLAHSGRRFEFGEVFLELLRQHGGLDVVSPRILPGIARIQKLRGHLRATHGDA